MPRKNNNCLDCGNLCQGDRCLDCRNLYFKTEEWKRKMRESHKTSWNKGKKFIHSKSFKKGHKGYSGAGEKNSNWKGGRNIHNGYVLIYNPKHSTATKQGYVLEHRLLMEKKLGRYLTKEEVVHHENGIGDDNRIENLKLFKNQNEHVKYHHLLDAKKKSFWKRIINFVLNTFKEKND